MSASMQTGSAIYRGRYDTCGRRLPYATDATWTVAGSCECDGTGDYLCDECRAFAASVQYAPAVTYGWTKDGAR